MSYLGGVGKSAQRKEAFDKVTGAVKYTNDCVDSGMLHVKMVTSPFAHANILSIDTVNARKVRGVRAIVIGSEFPVLTGEEIRDRPIIAIDKVRYHGEPVAIVVADTEYQAKRAADLVKVEYQPLPVVNSPSNAIQTDAPLVHEHLASYARVPRVFPKPNTNIANHTKIRKGDIHKGFEKSDIVVEANYTFPPSDHAAMETRCAILEILPDGRIVIHASTQSPFMIKRLFQSYLNIEQEKVIVHVPLVGGAYGGKVAVQLELMAYIASKAVAGKKVKLVNSREEDLITSPVHIGLDAKVRFGATKDGKLMAAEILYLYDGGAYSDKAVDISRAGAVDCTGPYAIENIWCDSLCMYTNHPYATAYRGFGHPELTFAVERTIDQLAKKLGMDPLELRLKNAIVPTDTTPTQAVLTRSNIGNLPECLTRLKELLHWNEGQRVRTGPDKVRVKGIACLWKNSTIDTDAGSGAILTFNRDGSINLSCGVVEIGTGTKTVLAQLVAEKLKMDLNQISVQLEVNTKSSPEHWKTVASRGIFLAGRAVLAAAEDAIRQLKHIAARILDRPVEDLDVGYGWVYVKDTPNQGIPIQKVAHGFRYPDGHVVGSQIIGRGSYTMRHLTTLDPETGKGLPGPEWAVAAQGVEVEFDTKEYTYKMLKAVTVIDVGKVLNPKLAEGQVMGGMHMGLSFAARETYFFNEQGIILNHQLRTYHLSRFGDNPEFLVDFVETPCDEGPFGARGIGEYAVIGMPAALANSLSLGADIELNRLPLLPEFIWRAKKENQDDSV